ncbi:MAG: hypothetical protein ACE5JO_04920 [Candidatus Binatia bacterium]
MTGSEEQVLKIVRELRVADREAVNRKMRVSPAYVGQLSDALVFLRAHRRREAGTGTI